MVAVVLINPLGAALSHYEREAVDVLNACGATTVVRSILEPSASGTGRIRWLTAYLRELLRARRGAVSAVVILWPPIGYLDVIAAMVLGGRRCWIVMHDPVPLVAAVGFGSATRRCARIIRPNRLVTHSAAADHAVESALGHRTTRLPHPLFSVCPSQRRHATRLPVVRVLGQYKNDRDLLLLNNIASALGGETNLEILGRGWPAVAGWSVHSEFVSEDAFGHAIETADVVVIPYKRFFQSGVAVRCLERGTPVVGPAGTSLDDLLGANSGLLVHSSASPAAWVDAIEYAIEQGRPEMHRAALAARAAAVDEWGKWLRIVLPAGVS